MLVARIARDIRKLQGVKYTLASVADTDQRNAYQGTTYVRLVDLAEREYGQLDMMDFVRKHILPNYADENLRISVTPVSIMSGGGMSAADVQYMIGGPDMQKLEQYAKAVMADLRQVPGAVDVDSSLSTGKPQYGIRVDRPKAAELGVSIAHIANTLRLLVAGDKVSDYTDRGEQYEVHVRAIADVRNRLDEVKMITVPSIKFGTIPLGDVVHFEKGAGPAEINRLGRTRQVTISANMTPGTSQQTLLDALDESAQEAGDGARIPDGAVGQIEGNGQGVPGILPGVHPGVHFRVPVHRRPVRVVAAPDHDSAVACR